MLSFVDGVNVVVPTASLFGYLWFQVNPKDHTDPGQQKSLSRMEQFWTGSLTPCWVQYLYQPHPSRTPQESWYHLQSSRSQLGEIQPPSPTNQSSPSRWAINSQGVFIDPQMVPQSGQAVNQTACSWCMQIQKVASPPMSFVFSCCPLIQNQTDLFSKRFQFLSIESELSPEIGPPLLFVSKQGIPESLFLLPINTYPPAKMDVASWSFCSIGQCETKAVRCIQGRGMRCDACYRRRRAKVKLDAVKEESAKNEAVWTVVVQHAKGKIVFAGPAILETSAIIHADERRPKRKYKNRSKISTKRH